MAARAQHSTLLSTPAAACLLPCLPSCPCLPRPAQPCRATQCQADEAGLLQVCGALRSCRLRPAPTAPSDSPPGPPCARAPCAPPWEPPVPPPRPCACPRPVHRACARLLRAPHACPRGGGRLQGGGGGGQQGGSVRVVRGPAAGGWRTSHDAGGCLGGLSRCQNRGACGWSVLRAQLSAAVAMQPAATGHLPPGCATCLTSSQAAFTSSTVVACTTVSTAGRRGGSQLVRGVRVGRGHCSAAECRTQALEQE
jgi:hypothetical protein